MLGRGSNNFFKRLAHTCRLDCCGKKTTIVEEIDLRDLGAISVSDSGSGLSSRKSGSPNLLEVVPPLGFSVKRENGKSNLANLNLADLLEEGKKELYAYMLVGDESVRRYYNNKCFEENKKGGKKFEFPEADDWSVVMAIPKVKFLDQKDKIEDYLSAIQETMNRYGILVFLAIMELYSLEAKLSSPPTNATFAAADTMAEISQNVLVFIDFNLHMRHSVDILGLVTELEKIIQEIPNVEIYANLVQNHDGVDSFNPIGNCKWVGVGRCSCFANKADKKIALPDFLEQFLASAEGAQMQPQPQPQPQQSHP